MTTKGAQGVCVTEKAHKAAVSRGVTKICAEHEADAKRVGKHRKAKGTAQAKENACLARLEDAQNASPVIPWRSPWFLRVGLDVSLVALGSGTGIAAGVGLPGELVVGLSVGTIAALVGRLVVEWLDGP